MKYWLHRIKQCPNISHPLIKEKALLSIGFSEIAITKDFLEYCKGNKPNFDKLYKKTYKGEIWISRLSLWRFAFEMKKGDFVVVPGPRNFSVYKIKDDTVLLPSNIKKNLQGLKDWDGNSVYYGGEKLRTENNQVIDLGVFRKVEPIEIDISSNDYADRKLTSMLKCRFTNVDISALSDSVNTAIKAFAHRKPIDLHAIVLEENAKTTCEKIKQKLNPDKFERLIKWYFERIDANEVIIPPKNHKDKKGDIDIQATFEHIKAVVYVQAKFHTGETDSWAVEQINDHLRDIAGIDDGYSKLGWVISMADAYTPQAKNLAMKRNIHLINGLEFTKMLLEVGTPTVPE